MFEQYICNQTLIQLSNQEFFYASEKVAGCVENSKLRVIHKSLMFDSVKQADIDLLKEVLDALQEKYKEEEGKTNSLTTKLGCCSTNSESEAELEANMSNNNPEEETLVASLQELEDAHVQFARQTQPELDKTSKYEDLRGEIAEMNDRVGDLKKELKQEKRTSSPLWDAVNEEGETVLHLTTSKKHFQPEATRMLLDVGANPNIQNSQGETALHNACSQGAIDEVTSLIEKGAGLVLNKKNEPPALENLFSENQEAEKINKMMVSIQKSTDKIKMWKKLFSDARVHLTMIEKPDMLKALLETEEEADPDLVPFVNIQHEGNSPLHLAVEAKCHASASHLLRAGGHQMRLNEANFTPAIEELFGREKVAEITVHLVKGLIRKAKMKLLDPYETMEYLRMVRPEGGCLLNLVEETSWWDELAATESVGSRIANFAASMPVEFLKWLVTRTEEEKWNKTGVYNYLCQPNQEDKTPITRLSLEMPMWTKLSMWVKKGLQFRVENKEVAEALKTWYNTTIDPHVGEEEQAEEAELVRSLIEKRGVVVKLLENDDDLRPVVQLWNERNKNLGEYSSVLLFVERYFIFGIIIMGGHDYDMMFERISMNM